MKIALRELVRRPGRFAPVCGAFTLLVVLLVVLGGFLDGLQLSQTGSYRAQGESLVTYSRGAELLRGRSRVEPATTQAVRGVDGVQAAGGVAAVPTVAEVAGSGDLLDVVVFGYELGAGRLPTPPPPGEVVIDSFLQQVSDVQIGDRLRVGPQATPLLVAAVVKDASEGAPTLWVEPGTWRELVSTAQPAAALPEDVFQALVVVPEPGMQADEIAGRIDRTTGATRTVGVDDAIGALPVVAQQSATFQGIIAVTFVVSLLVVALFFALLTLERSKLYAVLKALGARSGDLVRGVALQAVGVALVALLVGGLVAVAFVALLPADLPLRLVPVRLGTTALGAVVTAAVGALLTLRRILRIDPAESIG